MSFIPGSSCRCIELLLNGSDISFWTHCADNCHKTMPSIAYNNKFKFMVALFTLSPLINPNWPGKAALLGTRCGEFGVDHVGKLCANRIVKRRQESDTKSIHVTVDKGKGEKYRKNSAKHIFWLTWPLLYFCLLYNIQSHRIASLMLETSLELPKVIQEQPNDLHSKVH